MRVSRSSPRFLPTTPSSKKRAPLVLSETRLDLQKLQWAILGSNQ
jgi:hypothetical protein